MAEACHSGNYDFISLHSALCLLHPLPVLHHSRRVVSYNRNQSRPDDDRLPPGSSRCSIVVEYIKPGVRPPTSAGVQLPGLNGRCDRLRRVKFTPFDHRLSPHRDTGLFIRTKCRGRCH